MKQFDENELRKKIRSDLQKKHQEKKSPNETEITESKNGEIKISAALKNLIRQIEEDRLHSQHPQFIRCENHLHETTWLTALEKAEQHEYYVFEESRWERLKNIIFSSSKTNIPQTKEVEEYRNRIVAEIEKDIDSRLQKYQELIKHYEHKKQKNLIDDIIEQEEEDFYKSHPDYKLYRNYLGDTRWLTDEEYEKEEEYTERLRSTREKVLIYTGWIALFLVIVAAVYFLKSQFSDIPQNGYVSISVNESPGQFYIDEKLVLGFTSNLPIPLAIGPHSITYRKDGYLSTPKIHNINITLNDTSKLEFSLSSKSIDSQGFVKIDAPYNDSKLFVDDEFYGNLENNKKLFLEAGNHSIELQKDNFYITPSSKNITVNEGDTIEIKFIFEPKSNGTRKTSSIKTGLLEVSSTVKGAKIFLNRKDSGQETNYVFNKLPLTNYIVSVEKDGYKSFPAEKEIKLSSDDNYSKTIFNLTRTTMPVIITTRPVNGKIYVDDREVGQGKWSGSLPIGVHEIRFGDVSFFKQPKETEFVVDESGSTDFTFRYEFNFSIEFKPSGTKPDNVNAKIQKGYVDEDGKFVSDPKNGPKTRRIDVLKDDVWWLGNAFNYRIPPANEAIELSFYLPEKSEFGYDFSMKLWGYNGELSYPLEISSGCYIRIQVNNTEIHQKYEPDYKLAEAGENKFTNFQLGNVLWPGRNIIVISTAKINKAYFALWKIEIE